MAATKSAVNTAKSTVYFGAKKLGFISVKGRFNKITGQAYFNPLDLSQAFFNLKVNANSLDSGNSKRDTHLKSKDFFTVERYPFISFKSNRVELTNTGFSATGPLRILETSLEVEIPFQFKNGALTGAFTLKRADYNLGKKIPALMVSKTIEVSFSLVLNS